MGGKLTRLEILDAAVVTELHRLRRRAAQLKELLALRQEVAKLIVEMKNIPDSTALELIFTTVCARFQKDTAYVRSHSRREEYHTPRACFCWLARNLTSASLSEIGATLGGRDHGTISYTVAAMQNRVDTEPKMKALLDELAATLKPELEKQNGIGQLGTEVRNGQGQ